MPYKTMMSIVATVPLIFLIAFVDLFRGIPLDIPPMIATGTIAALSFGHFRS